MKLSVDTARCAGHGRCAVVAPGFVELDDTGYNRTPVIAVPPGEEVIGARVVKACPERIIQILEGSPTQVSKA